MSWKFELLKALSGPRAPAVLSSHDLELIVRSIRPTAAPLTIKNAITQMLNGNVLVRVTHGVYGNRHSLPPFRAEEGAQRIRTGAVVSLWSVLGEFGITNNPSFTVSAVIPQKTGQSNPASGEVKSGSMVFRFYSLPERFFQDPEGGLGLYIQGRRYPCISPEKALVDWLHLAASPRSKVNTPPIDLDLSSLDRKKLNAIAKHFGADKTLADYLKTKRELHDGEEHPPSTRSARKLRP